MRELIRKALRDISNWINNSDTNYPQDAVGYGIPSSAPRLKGSISPTLDSSDGGLTFVVFNATGGKIIKTSHYDVKTDRHYSSLYIVTDKEDLGEEIAQILTRESLTR